MNVDLTPAEIAAILDALNRRRRDVAALVAEHADHECHGGKTLNDRLKATDSAFKRMTYAISQIEVRP